MEKELSVLLANEQLRITTPRKEVFAVLHESSRPLAITEIVKQCPSADRVSVYRTVDLFASLDIIKTVPMGWKQHYELNNPFRSHHHHLSCVKCGTLIDIHSKKFEDFVASIAAEHHFLPQDHTFEVKGLCSDCS